MQRLRIDIAANGAVATALVAAGPAFHRAEVLAALQTAGVVHGIDQAAIDALVLAAADPKQTGKHPLANGTAKVDGEDGRVELLQVLGPTAGRIGEGDGIDFRERDLLMPVLTGTQLARLVPPSPGQDGRDVRGRTQPAKPGKPARLQTGPGVQVDGERLLAACDGVRSWTPPRLDVVTATVHAADVDYKSGNLRTEGSLSVRGDVQQGFTVTAAHDLVVQGSVFDATVTAGGNAHIDGAAAGPHCRIETTGDLACHHATGPTLIAGGTIAFGDAATHCQARATAIVAQSGRGTVVGGELRAKERIAVRTAGNGNGARTTLVVGDTTAAAAAFLRTYHADLRLSQRAMLQGHTSGPNAGKALRTAVRLADPITKEVLALREQARVALLAASLDVSDGLHAGVHVVFGEHRVPIETPRRAVRLRWNEQDQTIAEEPLP